MVSSEALGRRSLRNKLYAEDVVINGDVNRIPSLEL